MPAEVVTRLNAECVRALAQPDLREKLALLGTSEIPTQSAREFGSSLAGEGERCARVIKDAGLKLDTLDR